MRVLHPRNPRRALPEALPLAEVRNLAAFGGTSRSSDSRRIPPFTHRSPLVSTTPHPQRARAITLLFLATLVWGLSFPLIKSIGLIHGALLPGSSTWLVTACTVGPRFLLAGLVLLLWRWRTVHSVTPREWKQGIGLAIACALGLLFQVDGLQRTAASVSAFLTQLYAILIPLFVAWRTRRRPTTAVLAACVLVVAGVGLLAEIDFRAFRLGRGELETLLSSLFFMGQILWLERREFAGNSVTRTTTVMFLVLGFGYGVVALALAPNPRSLFVLGQSPAWVGLTLVLTAACTLFCFTVMNAWQPKISATEAGLIYTLEPVSASALALFLPAGLSVWTGIAYANEKLTWHLLAGGALLTAANVLVQLPTGMFSGKRPVTAAAP